MTGENSDEHLYPKDILNSASSGDGLTPDPQDVLLSLANGGIGQSSELSNPIKARAFIRWISNKMLAQLEEEKVAGATEIKSRLATGDTRQEDPLAYDLFAVGSAFDQEAGSTADVAKQRDLKRLRVLSEALAGISVVYAVYSVENALNKAYLTEAATEKIDETNGIVEDSTRRSLGSFLEDATTDQSMFQE